MPKYQSAPQKKSIQSGSIGPRRKQARTQFQEFGLAKKEFVVCPECRSAYFHKSWHHNISEDAKHFHKDKPVRFELCPADKMKKEKRFEGQLAVSWDGVADTARTDILNTIRNSDRQAQEKDTLDRILWMEDTAGELKVYTSENQLAVRMGKKLKSSYRGSTLEIVMSHEEEPVRVYWKHARQDRQA